MFVLLVFVNVVSNNSKKYGLLIFVLFLLATVCFGLLCCLFWCSWFFTL